MTARCLEPERTDAAGQVWVLDATTAIDTLIFSDSPYWYGLSLEVQQERTDRLVRAAFEFHLENCPLFRAYVEREIGLRGIGSLEEIPLVSTRAFKFSEISSVPASMIEQWYRSSGTSGLTSRVPRDRRSLERLVGSVHSVAGLLGRWDDDGAAVVNLGPGREHVDDVWFQYVMSLIEAIHETDSIIPSSLNDMERIAAACKRRLAEYDDLIIAGPPFYIASVCDFLEERGRPVQGESRITVLTAGGWKRVAGADVDRKAFRAQVRQAFNLTSEAQIRDVFNQVELNSVLFECSVHEKHVPPWVHVAPRDPDTLLPVPDGQLGIMSYLDASCTAFPCFILAEDLGTVVRGKCACGREGVRVDIVRRVETRAAKGCALTMGRLHAARQRQ